MRQTFGAVLFGAVFAESHTIRDKLETIFDHVLAKSEKLDKLI